jgi:hypothetical protein
MCAISDVDGISPVEALWQMNDADLVSVIPPAKL